MFIRPPHTSPLITALPNRLDEALAIRGPICTVLLNTHSVADPPPPAQQGNPAFLALSCAVFPGTGPEARAECKPSLASYYQPECVFE